MPLDWQKLKFWERVEIYSVVYAQTNRAFIVIEPNGVIGISLPFLQGLLIPVGGILKQCPISGKLLDCKKIMVTDNHMFAVLAHQFDHAMGVASVGITIILWTESNNVSQTNYLVATPFPDL
jgi:hypothetical protein